MKNAITLAIDALASAAFIEGGVSPENTEAARNLTDQRKRELVEAIAAPQCLYQIEEPATKTEALAHYSQQAILAMDEAAPAAVAVSDALREAEAALEVAIARILKADPGHSISVTSEAKALVAVRAALSATSGAASPMPRLHIKELHGTTLPGGRVIGASTREYTVPAPAAVALSAKVIEALQMLENGALNVAENAKSRGDGYDEGYANAMAKMARETLAALAATPAADAKEAEAELQALRDVYEQARGVLRYDGIDTQRAIKYRDGLIEAIEEVKTIDGGTWEPAPVLAAPLPLLMRDIARDLGISAVEACQSIKDLGNFSVNTAVTAEMALKLRELFPAPQAAPAAVAVPAEVTGLLEALESMVDVCEGHDFDGAPSDAHMDKARVAISAYRAALAATPAAVEVPAVPKWIDDPHDIEQGQMLNPEWVKAQEVAAAPVVLPEPDFKLDGGETGCFYESTVRALLATATRLPAQSVDADSLKLLADIRSMAESTIKAGLVDDRELLHTFETIVKTAAKAKRPICSICDSKGFIAFDDEQARGRNGGKWGVCKVCTTAAPQAQADARDADGMYYLQDARHCAMVGNCPSFWRPGGNGYTTNLDEAERFTFEEAMKQHQRRETDLPWRCSEVDKLRRPTVDCQYMPRSWDAQRESIAAIAAAKGKDQ